MTAPESRRVAVDTSVALPLLVRSHAQHDLVARWARGRALALSGHAAIETYSVLTRLPGDARLASADAIVLIDDNFGDPLALGEPQARTAHRELAARGISGGAVYDGLVALAAREHGVLLATRDARARATYEALGVDLQIIAS